VEFSDLIQATIQSLVEPKGQGTRSDPSVVLRIMAGHGKLQLEIIAIKLI